MTHDTNDAGGGAVAPSIVGDTVATADMTQTLRVSVSAYIDWKATDENIRALANTKTEFCVIRELALELIAAREFLASLKAKTQQSIIITPRHFEAFERGETVP